MSDTNETLFGDTQTTNTRRPDWVVKTPRSKTRNAGLMRIGAAWDREDGGICVRLTGHQIVTGDLYIYPALEPQH